MKAGGPIISISLCDNPGKRKRPLSENKVALRYHYQQIIVNPPTTINDSATSMYMQYLNFALLKKQ